MNPVAAVPLVGLQLAVNDEANGMPSGHVDTIEVWVGRHPVLELETGIPGPRCLIQADGQLRIGRHQYPWVRRQTWVGNWCWDQVDLHAADAARLLGHLRASGIWCVDCADEPWFRWWEDGHVFSAADFGG